MTFEKLKLLFATATKTPIEEILGHVHFREYGIDSIMIIHLNKMLEAILGDISKTLFYQYQTLNDLTHYLVKEYMQQCVAWVGGGEPSSIVAQANVLPEKDMMTTKGYEPIAIIGLAGRYPDADNIEKFWKNLKSGKESITEIPIERWDWREYFVSHDDYSLTENKSYSKWGGFVHGFNEFDSLFFHISPREALSIDPQERLFLQCAWEAIEDAGYTRMRLKQHKVGVFVGITKTGFESYRSDEGLRRGFNPRTSFGSVANRVSYFFDLDGPSLPIDTMCSSSLTAIHIACQHIHDGSCNLALVGGVNLYLHPSNYVFLSQMRMLSHDGKNRSFGADGNGFVPGEGVGAVLLKRLSEAERDGDMIYGVICSSTVNHGGQTAGFTVPNPNAQRDLVLNAIQLAGLNAHEISYIEAHGTGTALGDPIEITGLTQAFQHANVDNQYCAIGSVKSNIGHLEAAAGIAGLTKVLLQLKHRQIVPSLHAKITNPNIHFEKTPFYVQQELAAWQQPLKKQNTELLEGDRIAGISSFGAGGTNAHVIVKEYRRNDVISPVQDKPVIIVWSAQYEKGLKAYAKKLHRFLTNDTTRMDNTVSLINIAYSLSERREAMTFRAAVIVSTMDELLDRLQQIISEEHEFNSSVWYTGEVNQALEADANKTIEMDQFILTRHWVGLASSWVLGASVNWSQLYALSKPQHISLPTYSFLNNRIWFDAEPRPQQFHHVQEKNTTTQPFSLPALSTFVEQKTSEKLQHIEANNKMKVEVNRSELTAKLMAQLAELLFLTVEDIKSDDIFLNLGLDSIIGVEWVKKINHEFGVKLSATKLYDYPTLDELSHFIRDQMVPQPIEPVTPVLSPNIAAHSPQIKTSIKLSDLKQYAPIAPIEDVTPQLKHASAPSAVTLQPTHASVPVTATSNTQSGKIAIIGLSGQFPGAKDVREFWNNLSNGVDSIIEIPENRWNVKEHYDPHLKAKGKSYSNKLGALDDIDAFDPLFFNISPLEAECMDPQQRLFLQEAWKAFEDAGYTPEKLQNIQCGTYVGVMQNDYAQNLYEHPEYQGLAQTASGNSSAILAARMAYLLNLKGPALAVDTACSSSLVATHLACNALRTNEIDIALVGGVTLYLRADGYQRMCDAGMLSPSGKCFSFDNRADGFVPGEAVVSVILKRVEDAIRDKDHIHGVIIASGINQDGKTNGITAPSVNSQIKLQRDVYTRFNINPSTIGYVEAHGTGTKLGDPIEMEALSAVYSQYGCQKQSCAIGSVKSNVGHTSAGAGLVGLLKILLSMKHKQLVPSLNYEQSNEHIDMKNSPFYVNTARQDWMVVDHSPRRAALNSFGFSGTNAHLVIEEPPLLKSAQLNLESTHEWVMIPLSAKKPDRLRVMAKQLQQALMTDPARLLDVAYTLQTGRQDMNYRVVFIVKHMDELIDKLNQFHMHAEVIENVVEGQVIKERSTLHALYFDEDMQLIVQQWMKKGKAHQLAEVWASGVPIDWSLFYSQDEAKRIPLPTYPFMQERYWIHALDTGAGDSKKPVLHPLVQENISNFNAQQFGSIFVGDEFFLCHHQLNQQKILPGVAYLEMARVAVANSHAEPVTYLSHVIWATPIVLDVPQKETKITLQMEHDSVRFMVKSHQERKGDVVHSQGWVHFNQPKFKTISQRDIAPIQARCNVLISPDELYQQLAQIGVHYGPSFRCLDSIGCNKDEVLATFKLPDMLLATASQYLLHPSVMDSALQAAFGLIKENLIRDVLVPSSISQVAIYGATPQSGYVYVKRLTSEQATLKFDIDVLDVQGKCMVSMHEIVFKPWANRVIHPNAMLARYQWQEQALSEAVQSSRVEQTEAILVDIPAPIVTTIRSFDSCSLDMVHSLNLVDDEERALQLFTDVFGKLQTLLSKKPSQVQFIIIVPVIPQAHVYAPLVALLKTLSIEYPKIRAKLIQLDVSIMLSNSHVLTSLRQEISGDFNDISVRYMSNGTREVQRLIELHHHEKTTPHTYFKSGGVYWFTGGLGGLGRLITKHLIKHQGITLLLSGRSEITPRQQQELNEWVSLGIRVDYIPVNLSDKTAVKQKVKEIKQRYGQLNGILHASGVLEDALILKKTKQQIEAVFKSKVFSLVAIDEATKHEPLDFILLFSSIAGVMGNLGQADYSGANAFLDAFAEYRNKQVEAGVRYGHTVSINWPLWRDGGMQTNEQSKQWFLRKTGIDSLSTSDGLNIFDSALNYPFAQWSVLPGNHDKIRDFLSINHTTQRSESYVKNRQENVSATISINHQTHEADIKQICSDLLKIDKKELDFHTEFSEYGLDSILMMNMLNKLEDKYACVFEPSIVIDNPTIERLANYIQSQGLSSKPNREFDNSGFMQNSEDTLRFSIENSVSASEKPAGISRKIAIISQACRLPKSPNLEMFWDNLQSGRDVITEVSPERWDPESVYHSVKGVPGKTYTNLGGFLDDIAEFDAQYFGISDEEAMTIDPQQRIILELSQELFERAGYQRETIDGSRTSIFVGAKENNYLRNHYDDIPDALYKHAIVNSIGNMIAARVSDFYNLTGVAKTIDTACSSSLVAIHDACQNILNGESEMAIAGGIFLLVDSYAHVGFSQAQVLSDDGKSYVFDERAQGFVLGEGAGLVLLKAYDAAVRDQDNIIGVIHGSAVNNDGKTMGLTVPNQDGQKKVIEEALYRSQINPELISYLEAHGTGTLLGDPIEIRAATQVYQQYTTERQFCAIGSVKSNVGHTMTAAGVVSLIKVLLSMQHQKIPATLNCSKPHPRFKFDESPFYPNTELSDWQPRDGRRIAAISSLGFGGTNCHMIVEEAGA